MGGERRKGRTIDLGFAWTDLGGVEVGFFDVPGHERFIKNRLAGDRRGRRRAVRGRRR